jgi:ankyrin repeat protein
MSEKHIRSLRGSERTPGHFELLRYLRDEAVSAELLDSLAEGADVTRAAGYFELLGRDAAALLLLDYLNSKSDANLYAIDFLFQVAGADPKALKEDGMSYLSFAQTYDVTQRLISNGVDVNAGWPVGWATQNGLLEVLRCLRLNGADMQVANAQGKTPLSLAQEQVANYNGLPESLPFVAVAHAVLEFLQICSVNMGAMRAATGPYKEIRGVAGDHFSAQVLKNIHRFLEGLTPVHMEALLGKDKEPDAVDLGQRRLPRSSLAALTA